MPPTVAKAVPITRREREADDEREDAVRRAVLHLIGHATEIRVLGRRPLHEALHHPHLDGPGHQLHGNRNHEMHDGANQPGHRADDRAVSHRDRGGLVLLQQISRDRAAADDPHAAAAVASADERERREHADDDPADDRRLETGLHGGRSSEKPGRAGWSGRAGQARHGSGGSRSQAGRAGQAGFVVDLIDLLDPSDPPDPVSVSYSAPQVRDEFLPEHPAHRVLQLHQLDEQVVLRVEAPARAAGS